MRKTLVGAFLLIIFFLNLSCSLNPSREPQSNSQFIFKTLAYDTKTPLVNTVNLRTGVLPESTSAKFKGCVLYLEGLADSIQNHIPLFQALSDAGYRTVAFDYIGQGGSEGSMNHTRVHDVFYGGLEIGRQAAFIWNQQSECAQSKKLVIGWSTGGLAAYKLAHEEWADAVVLIAPGIQPKKFIGEAATTPSLFFSSEPIITERTLTRNKFERQTNPHIDPIKPTSPLQVPLFSKNLLVASALSQSWKISKKIKGLVFLSGSEDTYVDREKTIATLNKNAPHFYRITYNGALHELDNELPEVADDVRARIIRFFQSYLGVD